MKSKSVSLGRIQLQLRIRIKIKWARLFLGWTWVAIHLAGRYCQPDQMVNLAVLLIQASAFSQKLSKIKHPLLRTKSEEPAGL